MLSKGRFARNSTWFSKLFSDFDAQKLVLFLTKRVISCDELASLLSLEVGLLLAKYSIVLNLFANTLRSFLRSTRFFCGVGVNFKPFLRISNCCLVNVLQERLNILGFFISASFVYFVFFLFFCDLLLSVWDVMVDSIVFLVAFEPSKISLAVVCFTYLLFFSHCLSLLVYFCSIVLVHLSSCLSGTPRSSFKFGLIFPPPFCTLSSIPIFIQFISVGVFESFFNEFDHLFIRWFIFYLKPFLSCFQQFYFRFEVVNCSLFSNLELDLRLFVQFSWLEFFRHRWIVLLKFKLVKLMQFIVL